MNNESANTEATVEIITPVFTPQKRKRAVFDSLSSSEFCGVYKVRYQNEEEVLLEKKRESFKTRVNKMKKIEIEKC